MDINYLQEFVTLAVQKNYLETATDLYISQSVLSKHIQKMENELGVALFIRSTRGVELSEAGKLFLPYAKKILQVKKLWENELEKYKNSSEKTIEIGSVAALAQYNITDLIAVFKKSHQDITLNVTLDRSSRLFDHLRNGVCDIAFIREAEQMDSRLDKEFIRIPYASDTLVAVLPSFHPLASQKSVNLKALSEENFLFLGTDNMPGHLCRNACLRAGFEPNVTFTNRYPENLIQLVKSGMGIALLMKPLAEFSATPDVSVVDISPPVYSFLSLFYLREKKLSSSVELFLKEFSRFQKEESS